MGNGINVPLPRGMFDVQWGISIFVIKKLGKKCARRDARSNTRASGKLIGPIRVRKFGFTIRNP